MTIIIRTFSYIPWIRGILYTHANITYITKHPMHQQFYVNTMWPNTCAQLLARHFWVNACVCTCVFTYCKGILPKQIDAYFCLVVWDFTVFGPCNFVVLCASYQIRKIAGVHAPGTGEKFSPPPRVAIPTCITARAWRTFRDACRGR